MTEYGLQFVSASFLLLAVIIGTLNDNKHHENTGEGVYHIKKIDHHAEQPKRKKKRRVLTITQPHVAVRSLRIGMPVRTAQCPAVGSRFIRASTCKQ